MDVDFDRETITVVSYDTLIDKNHGYTKSGTISHRALMKIDGRNIKQLDLPFHMKTDYIEISAKTALILVII